MIPYPSYPATQPDLFSDPPRIGSGGGLSRSPCRPDPDGAPPESIRSPVGPREEDPCMGRRGRGGAVTDARTFLEVSKNSGGGLQIFSDDHTHSCRSPQYIYMYIYLSSRTSNIL